MPASHARTPRGKQHRFQCRHAEERLHQLETSGHAELDELIRLQAENILLAEPHRPPVGSQEARQDVEQARLSRTVGPDDAEDGALLDLERKVVDRGDTTERLAETRHREQVQDGVTGGRREGCATTECAPARGNAPCPKD